MSDLSDWSEGIKQSAALSQQRQEQREVDTAARLPLEIGKLKDKPNDTLLMLFEQFVCDAFYAGENKIRHQFCDAVRAEILRRMKP